MNRTILLIRNAAKEDFGGAETYQISLANTLMEMDYKPIIVSGSDKLLAYANENNIKSLKGWWWSRQNWSGYRILLAPAYLAWQLILTVWYIALIIKTKPLALHIQSRDDFIAGTLAGKLTGRSVIWTDHMDLRYVFENIKNPLKNIVGKLVYTASLVADHIILISDNEYKLVTEKAPNSKRFLSRIKLVRNGVIDISSQLEPKRETNELHLCVASRIVKNKGVREAIEAFISLQDTDLTAEVILDIYGDGADIDEFKQIAKGYARIIFHGHQNNAIQKVNQSDIFILPSYQEGFSIALLEATMLGKPIITSNVDSNPEIIQHEKNGLLVDARNVSDLANAMYKLISNTSLRTNLGRSARKSYLDNYRLKKIVSEQITPLYNHQD